MMGFCCLAVFLILSLQVVTEGKATPDQNDQITPRNRGLQNITCLKGPTNKTINLETFETRIQCDCPVNSTVSWYNEDCEKIGNTEKYFIGNASTITALDGRKQLIFYCTDGKNCSNVVTVITADPADTVVIAGISIGLQVLVAIIIILFILLVSFFFYRKHKNRLYLCCRDLCKPANATDGKEYDAYVSIGKSTADMKFVQKNIVDILQRKYSYKFYIDDDNLLPQLDFSEKVQSKLHKCRRLLVLFTPAYMTNDWCMYCFSEGLRKLMELNIKMIFVISDVTIQREINSLTSIVGHVPKLFISFLPKSKKKRERDEIIQKIRLVLSPPCRSSTLRRGIRAPMLSEVEDIDERSVFDNESSKDTKISTVENTSVNEEDIEREKTQEETEYGFEDPNSIKVHEYKAKKNFYSITTVPKE